MNNFAAASFPSSPPPAAVCELPTIGGRRENPRPPPPLPLLHSLRPFGAKPTDEKGTPLSVCLEKGRKEPHPSPHHMSLGGCSKKKGTGLRLSSLHYVVQTHMLFTIIVVASPSFLQFFPFIVNVCLPSLLYRTGHMLPLLLLLLLPILNQPSLGIEIRPWRRRSPSSSSSFPFNLGVPEETFSPLSLRSMRRDAAARPMKWGRRGKSWI